jgi:hypothetical protein
VRLAALLHDVGKAVVLFHDESGEPRFHGHEKKSAELSQEITRRLKFPNYAIRKVRHLILHHMFAYQDEWSDSAVRRFITRVGKENIHDLFLLRRADQIAIRGGMPAAEPLLRFMKRIEELIRKDQVFGLKDLKINGRQIMAALALKPGPTVGIILDFLFECVLDDPKLNEPERLLELARNFYRERLLKD